MTLFANRLKNRGIVKADTLQRFVGQTVQTAGLLITGKVVSTKHGDPMEFLTFEDETGLMETTFFPKAYRKFCCMLDRHRPYMLTGTVDEDFGAVTLTVERAVAIRH
jgi:DNA polymerase-3 subunit alpha/error-prone DNA polymerase